MNACIHSPHFEMRSFQSRWIRFEWLCAEHTEAGVWHVLLPFEVVSIAICNVHSTVSEKNSRHSVSDCRRFFFFSHSVFNRIRFSPTRKQTLHFNQTNETVNHLNWVESQISQSLHWVPHFKRCFFDFNLKFRSVDLFNWTYGPKSRFEIRWFLLWNPSIKSWINQFFSMKLFTRAWELILYLGFLAKLRSFKYKEFSLENGLYVKLQVFCLNHINNYRETSR